MDDFETTLNDLLVDTFYNILKFEESSLNQISNVHVTVSEAHMIEVVGKQEKGEATVSNIAAQLKIAMPTVTVAVKKLESKGLIQKIPCEKDARRTIITLTDLGRKTDKVHQFFHVKMVRNISDLFLDSEKDVLIRAIEKLSESFRDRVDSTQVDDSLVSKNEA